MSAETAQRGWMSLSEAARYVGVSRDLLRMAVNAGDLPAYEKPVTRGRTGTSRHNVLVRIGTDDLDSWVRSWKPARF